MSTENGLSRRSVLTSSLVLGAGLLVSADPRAEDRAGEPHRDSTEEASTDLLIIGAGPFGLGLAAYAGQAAIPHTVVGAPMGFWRGNMPRGMLLRSGCDWSLDPLDARSIDTYFRTLGRRCEDGLPLSRALYLEYADWFQHEKGVKSQDVTVTSLRRERGGLVAVTDRGDRIRSRFVVMAIGFGNFANVPPELATVLPADSYDHSCGLVDFAPLAGRRILIVGGRQSAFESAALMRESGVASVHLAYRHDTPSFTTSDWRWVMPLVERMVDDPGWYRRLRAEERKQLDQRFWGEGRLKLEPWLAKRIAHPNITLHPRTRVIGADATDSGLKVSLDNGEVLTVDHVVLATGYKVDLARVPLLANGLLDTVEVRDGAPVLDEHFQTTVPGLYLTSLAASRDFGSFLAFTVSVRAQANIIGRHIATVRAG